MTWKKDLPDRWLDYKKVGKCIPGTRFIAFKVPLVQSYLSKVKSIHWFLPNNLFEIIPTLGLVIDLTNTKRYYSGEIFQRKGIKYRKVMCPGKVVPPEGILENFIDVVEEFLNSTSNKDSLIGVHCTHGVNRTGYFICSYMIRRMMMDPRDAIAAFEAARGHRIERKEFVQVLLSHQNSGSRSNVPRMPDLHRTCEASGSSSVKNNSPVGGAPGRRYQWNRFTAPRGCYARGAAASGSPIMNMLPWSSPCRSAPRQGAATPGREAPSTSIPSSSAWSSAPGPVASSSRKAPQGHFRPAYSGGAVRKSKVKPTMTNYSAAATPRYQPDRTWWPDDFAPEEQPSVSGSSEPSGSQFTREHHVSGSNPTMEDRRTSSHFQPRRLQPYFPMSQPSPTIPSSSESGRGHWGERQQERSREPVARRPAPGGGGGYGRGRWRGRGRGGTCGAGGWAPADGEARARDYRFQPYSRSRRDAGTRNNGFQLNPTPGRDAGTRDEVQPNQMPRPNAVTRDNMMQPSPTTGHDSTAPSCSIMMTDSGPWIISSRFDRPPPQRQ